MISFGTPRFPKRFGTQYFQTLTWNASWTIQGEIDARERLPGRNGYEVHGPVSFWAEFEAFRTPLGRNFEGPEHRQTPFQRFWVPILLKVFWMLNCNGSGLLGYIFQSCLFQKFFPFVDLFVGIEPTGTTSKPW
uniref:Uncharacterized protein n=1 Tax=Rhizophagus irregularis (strain DAOM 181602 / DAOM 197198 / MUCL 43194) TaxID=747089 RepID=U9UX38_RHIID